MSSILRFVVCFFVLAFALPANAQDGATEGKSPHITARLIAESATVAPNGDITLALDYTPAPGWHTYWLNSGDTGLPPKFKWNLPDGVTTSDAQFPTPELLPAFGLMSYGFTGRTVLLIPAHNGSSLSAGDTLPIKAHVDFLVCADVCIPESLDVSLNLTVGAPKPGAEAGVIDKARKALPVANAAAATIDLRNGEVELGFPMADVTAQGAYFFPAQGNVTSAPAPQSLDMGAKGFTLRTKAAGTGLPEGDLSGVLKLADGTAYAIRLNRAPLDPSVHGLGAASQATTKASLSGILIAIAGAFIGGLILNLMPCVFPVLSMKLLSLARSGHDKGLAQQEALFYGAGTIITFVSLALILMAARAFGQSIGWGFQLQSPYVTAGLSLVMLLVALNMSGVFEIGSSLQAVGGIQVSSKRPRLSALLTGVLAVVVAAPCTAPFMATAIGVALAQGGLVSFAVFVSLGVGFALPFVVLTFLITLVPGFARVLPRPGKWMDVLKHVLSLLMYAACLWLVWVFAQQVEPYGLILLIFALALVVIAVLKSPLPKFVKPLVLAGGLVLCGLSASLPRAEKIQSLPSGLLPHRDFSVETLASLRAEGKPVFVDLTAAWCVTCKVNERLVLTTKDFEKAVADTGTVYMVGDWTNQDAAIARYLTLFGRSGVPLYVYYGPNNAEPVVLPQLLKTADVVKVIRRR
ncbi:protein-disulfide reductase DsbD family protein [Asticcacaulis taihuensis]|uniref:protein-disulfide reductase DsbD family protein n=1 Tax=Asticcacaulis taihuensis TaxID=260084 RepID=UPI003F7B645F